MEQKAFLFTGLFIFTIISSCKCNENTDVSKEESSGLKITDLEDIIEGNARKLDRITDILEYLLRREKMEEFCPPDTCDANGGVCTLSENLTSSYCQCKEGFVGKRCEISGACPVEQYRFAQTNTEQPFPYKCDPDGYFSAVQFNESGGYCVTNLNVVIPGYNRTEEDVAESGSCECARKKYWLQEHAETEERVITCKLNGDYAEMSCDEQDCWCQGRLGETRENWNFPAYFKHVYLEDCHWFYAKPVAT